MFINVLERNKNTGKVLCVFSDYKDGLSSLDLNDYKDVIAKYRPYIEMCESLEEWGELAASIHKEIVHLEELKKGLLNFIDTPY